MNYDIKFKPFRNIYDVIGSFYYISKIFGLAPYGRYKIKYKYVYIPYSSGQYLIPFCLSLLSITGIFLVAFTAKYELKLPTVEIALFLNTHIVLLLGGLIFIHTLPRRINAFLTAVKILYTVDKKLLRLGLSYSYRGIQILTVVAKSGFTLIPCFVVYHNLQGKSVILQMGEHLAFLIPFVATILPILYQLIFAVSVRSRLRLINSYLEELDLRKSANNNSVYIYQRIIYMSKLHQELCKILKYSTHSFSLAFLTGYFLSLTLIGGSSIIIINTGPSLYSSEAYFWTFVFSSLTIFLLSIMEIVKHESKKTSSILCQLVTSYVNKNVETTKRTLLLQLFHQKIDFVLCGLFDCSLSTFLQSTGSIINMVMFVLQIKNSLKE